MSSRTGQQRLDLVGNLPQLRRVQPGAEADREHGQRGELRGERLRGRHRPLGAGLGDERDLGRVRQRRPGAALVIASVPRPQSRAQARVSTISSVRPDWDSATASTPDRSTRLRYAVAIDGEASVASRPA